MRRRSGRRWRPRAAVNLQGALLLCRRDITSCFSWPAARRVGGALRVPLLGVISLQLGSWSWPGVFPLRKARWGTQPGDADTPKGFQLCSVLQPPTSRRERKRQRVRPPFRVIVSRFFHWRVGFSKL